MPDDRDLIFPLLIKLVRKGVIGPTRVIECEDKMTKGRREIDSISLSMAGGKEGGGGVGGKGQKIKPRN